MARVKGAMMTRKRRNKTLKLAKGYWGNKSRHFKMANQAVMKHCRQYFAQRVQSQLRRKPAMAGHGRSPCALLGFQRGHSLR